MNTQKTQLDIFSSLEQKPSKTEEKISKKPAKKTSQKKTEKAFNNSQRLVFLDTETTSAFPDARLIQIAYGFETGDIVSEYFKNPVPITLSSMAVHHITEKMLQEKSLFETSQTKTYLSKLLEENILVAHNANFDMQILQNEGIFPSHSICTYKVSVRVEPDLEEHKLQYLRYYYGIEGGDMTFAHEAGSDVWVLREVFQKLFERWKIQNPRHSDEETLQEMERISQLPVLLPRIRFGKYVGTAFKELPTDYLNWLWQNTEDENIKYTCEYYLSK